MKYILNFLFIVFLCFGISCGNGNRAESPRKVISAQEVINVLRENEIRGAVEVIVDGYYILPTKEWVVKEFIPSFRKFKFDNNIETWWEDSNDCDDASLAASVWAKVVYFKTNKREKAGLAFGEFYYLRLSDNPGHAVNFILVDNDGKIEVIFFEPQNNHGIIKLTEEEKFMCIFWRI